MRLNSRGRELRFFVFAQGWWWNVLTDRPKTNSLALAGLLLAAGWLCVPASARTIEQPTRMVVDETGRVVRVPTRIERIITLAPSLTEIVYALGLEDRLVGVTNQCDYPPAAQQKQRVGDVINPNLEMIVELKPDVVLGSKVDNLSKTVEAIKHLGVPLYGLYPTTVQGVLDSIRHIAELAGVAERGEALAGRLQAQLRELQTRLEQTSTAKPRLLFVVWVDPLIVVGGGTFLSDALTQAGGISVSAGLRGNWPRLSLEEVVELDPDFLVLPRSHGLNTRMANLSQRKPWNRLRAVRQNRVIWIDAAIERPGPRIVAVIEQLAQALHPQLAPAEVAAQ